MCLNYVQGGSCLIDARPCLLGSQGNEAKNRDRECPRHGPFDVWRTREGLILISDLGSPYEDVKDCYGLGISLREATRVAQEHALRLSTKIITTQRRCGKCGAYFWPRGHLTEGSTLGRAAGYFCASCLNLASEAELEECWERIASTQDRTQVDLSEWCG